MRLSELIAGLPLGGELGTDPEVKGLAYDSRRVAAGDLFVVWVGQRHDGRAFVAEAMERGAVAVLTPPPAASTGSEGADSGLPWLTAADPRALLGALASRLWEQPDRELCLVGVTGTNGKSTVVALVARLLEASGLPCGAIGTLGYRFRDLELTTGERTTPEASDLFRTLRAMRQHGARAAAMEVSSHALAQGRVEGARFDVGVFTNLTRDHFDFHRDFEEYFAAKRRLFAQLKPGGRAVVSVDDAYGRRLAAEVTGARLGGELGGARPGGELGTLVTFGREGMVRVREASLDAAGIRGALVTPRGEVEFSSPLLGRYNLDNILAAAAVGEALQLPLPEIAAGIAAQEPLPGRMEPVDCGQPFPVLIDYAHTDAALEAALRAVKEFAGRPVVLVFGCGGDRDPGKRQLMGRVAGELADLPIVTSDNPRSEDPLAIIAAIEEGLKASGASSYRVVPDRREAIRRAIAVASPGAWAVLVAGKGHEREQIVGGERFPFSDREELVRALAERSGSVQRA